MKKNHFNLKLISNFTLLLISLFTLQNTFAQQVTTIAGGALNYYQDGLTNADGFAKFKNPRDLTIDKQGNVYIIDYNNNRIRKITPSGIVSTLAGSGTAAHVDGIGTNASFITPTSIVVDTLGNVFITENSYNCIRKISPIGEVSTFAGSTTGASGLVNANGTNALFKVPNGITIDKQGNLYVTESQNYTIRKITPKGDVSTLAGGAYGAVDGKGTNAKFVQIKDITIDGSGNLFVVDLCSVRKITPTGDVTTFAGKTLTSGDTDSVGVNASFSSSITSICIDKSGNLYITDDEAIRKINSAAKTSTLIDNGVISGKYLNGNISIATFNKPLGIIVDLNGDLLISDSGDNAIRKITSEKMVSTLAGNGLGYLDGTTGQLAQFNNPSTLVTDKQRNIFVVDEKNNAIRKITPLGIVTTIAGTSQAGYLDTTVAIYAKFKKPSSIAIDQNGNLFVVDRGNNCIRKITTSGVVTTVAGDTSAGYADGIGKSAKFNQPAGIDIDASGNIFVADSWNNRIRMISPAGKVSTVAGTGAVGSIDANSKYSTFNNPPSLKLDKAGNIYVADWGNNKIRKILKDSTVITFAGTGAMGTTNGAGNIATFYQPTGLAMDTTGNLYVADNGYNLVRKITPQGVVSFIAGNYSSGYVDGIGSSARFNSPTGLAIDVDGNILVADYKNNRIRKITLNVVTGIDQDTNHKPTSIVIYPNPASTVLTISSDKNISGKLIISDINGNKILEQEINEITSHINVEKFSNGIYFVKIITESYTEIIKILIEK